MALKRNGDGGEGEFWNPSAADTPIGPPGRNAETFPASDPISIRIDDPADDERLEGEPS